MNGATTIGGVLYGTPTTAGSYPTTITVVSPGNASLPQKVTITISGSTGPIVPTITTPPVAATVNAGNNATFTVAASGTAPIGYFWLKNGNPLANAGNISGANTTTLTVANTSTADTGNYSVLVSNSVSTVTSAAVALTVIVPPAITSQPASQTQAVGSSATFSVTATGSAPLTYRWLKNGTNLVNGAKYSGVSSSALTVAALATTDAGNYSVAITNLAGSLTSSVAPLTVVSSPTITMPPANLSVTAGANAAFTVVATGSAPLVYQWLKNNSALANGGNVSGATTATLTLSAVGTGDVADYSVTVSNSLGGVISPAATLTVAIPPAIVTSPADATVTAGSNVSFTVSASGTAPLSYQWFKDNVKISGATSATLTLANISAADAASYFATVTNAVGTASSAAATLAVLSAPSIVVQPASQFGTPGSTLNLSVLATGTTPLSYQWFKGVTALTDDANISGSVSNVLTLTALTTNEAGSYFVVVSNFLGRVTSSNTVLSINANIAPVITASPASQTVAQNSQVIFTVTATGSNPLTYQWLKNGAKLANSATISGATSASLTLANVQANSGGSYSVLVTNGYGSATSAVATLTVLAVPTVTTPASRSAKKGATATFAVTAKGGVPLSYQWFKNGNPLTDGGNISGSTTSSLKISALTTNDAAVYAVTVTNLVGSATSGNATLTVFEIITRPVILAAPADQTAVVSHDVEFSVQVNGTVPMSFQWRKGNKVIPGATNVTLRLINVKTNDAATYSVIVKNPVGKVTSKPAKLTVWIPPLFTLQPANRISTNGMTTVFKATVSGTKPITYQWFKNGVAGTNSAGISGAQTDTLTVSDLHRSDAGVYTLRVTNVAGTNTSFNAALILKPARPSANDQFTGTPAVSQAGVTATPSVTTLQITSNPDGSMTLWVIGGQPGTNYVLEATEPLAAPTAWNDIGTNRAAGDGNCQLSDSHAGENAARFYRVRAQ